MATLTSSLQLDLTNFQDWTSSQAFSPFIAGGFAVYTDSAAMPRSFNIAGPALISLLSGPTGTVTEIHGYPGDPVTMAAPGSRDFSLTGVSVDAAVAAAFVTSKSQSTSLDFFSSVLSGNDSITGSSFDDKLFGGAGVDSISGGMGNDTVTYFNSLSGVVASLANGGGARGDAQGDTFLLVENLTGSAFADTLVGDNGENVLNGGTGNDILIGGLGADTLIGGDGTDTASYATAGNSVVVYLASSIDNSGLAAGDVLTGIENLTGSNYADLLYGDTGDNRLQGLKEEDVLYGEGGKDTLIGDEGNDFLQGGDGDDALQGGADDDTLFGGAGNDRLLGGTGQDVMTGGDGDDSYEVDYFRDSIVESAGGGTDRVTSTLEYYGLAQEVEVLILGDGAVYGQGNALDNTVKGNAAANTLGGGAGADTLQGLGGNDRLSGGDGNDRLYGGAGNDMFSFENTSGGVDRIMDWESGDQIQIAFETFGIDVSGGLDVVNGTNPASLTTDGVFYNTVSGRLYTFDADSDTLTNIALFQDKPAGLGIGDFAMPLLD